MNETSPEERRVGVDGDRREYFRIDDALHLSYRRVTQEELPALVKAMREGESNGFSVMANLCAIGQQMNAVMRRIEAHDPDVATYLKTLERKIDLLGRVFLASESDLAAMPARPVNLSGGGLAMYSNEALQEGSAVEIKILLRPSFTGVVAYGEVVSCETSEGTDGYTHLLRIHFTHIRPCDRDALIRHILARQSELIRQRREQRERD